MKSGGIILSFVILLLLICLGFLSGFIRYGGYGDREYKHLLAQLDRLTRESRDAIIIRRVSEQMEEVAYQQKNVSDLQRQEAVLQKTEADRMRKKAEAETGKAIQSRKIAIEALDKVEEQKRIAEERREEAQVARRKADTLAGLALGRSLGALAITNYRAGKRELAELLGYYAWKFTSENKGDCYLPEVFNALSLVSGLAGSYSGHKGTIRDIQILSTSEHPLQFVTVSSQGEVLLWGEKDGELYTHVLYSNPVYDFRKIAVDHRNGYIGVLSRSGTVLIMKGPDYQGCSVFDTGKNEACALLSLYGRLFVFYEDGTGICLPDDFKNIDPFLITKAGITAVCSGKNEIYLGDGNGKLTCLDRSGRVLWEKSTEKSRITAIAVDTMTYRLAIGYENGKILQHPLKNNKECIVQGHLSAVTGLAFSGSSLLSVGYDCTLNLWNPDSDKSDVLTLITNSGWLYCVAVIDKRVLCGGVSQTLELVSVSPEKMAEHLYGLLKRDFTKEERNYYINQEKGGKLPW